MRIDGRHYKRNTPITVKLSSGKGLELSPNLQSRLVAILPMQEVWSIDQLKALQFMLDRGNVVSYLTEHYLYYMILGYIVPRSASQMLKTGLDFTQLRHPDAADFTNNDYIETPEDEVVVETDNSLLSVSKVALINYALYMADHSKVVDANNIR